MASAAGVAGVRATLDLGSKSFKCVQCGGARFRADHTLSGSWPARSQLDVKRPNLSCDLRYIVRSQSVERRLTGQLGIPDTGAFIGTNQGALLPNCPSSIRWDLLVCPVQPLIARKESFRRRSSTQALRGCLGPYLKVHCRRKS
jgi:hypothetical protein